MKKINIEDKEYPQMLRKIKNAPQNLYVEGNIENLNLPCIAVIGSRACTQYGEKWCTKFVEDLVTYGTCIVSGMAIGIDSIAHNVAIDMGGKTIAVLPSGLDNIYPKENIWLYKKILENGGTVITEYESKEEKSPKKCLERNRIVSGLAMGVLVVEAAKKSGTSITAKLAIEQKRDVFCIPRKFR